MREIKFRAWDGKKMYEGVSPWRWDFVISNTWHRCEKSTGDGFLGMGGDTAEMLVPAIRFKKLMQFTGLRDKNGKEIYESDVITSDQFIENKAVDFTLGSFGVPDFHLWQLTSIEVIGNLYENPELLNP